MKSERKFVKLQVTEIIFLTMNYSLHWYMYAMTEGGLIKYKVEVM